MAHEDELSAFRNYLEVYPDAPTLLVDTYDTLKSGVPNAIRAFRELARKGWKGRPAIRLDSGDLAADSIAAHRMFAEAGFANPLIVASNELDEYLIADLKRQGAKINAWGVGTNLIACADDPALDGIYKLAAVWDEGAWHPRLKISGNPGKTTDPGAKTWVRFRKGSTFVGDVVFDQDEDPPLEGPVIGVDRTLFYRRRCFKEELRGEILLEPIIRDGAFRQEAPGLESIRRRALAQVEALPSHTRRLRNPHIYPVLLSEKLAEAKDRMLRNGGRDVD